MRGMAQIDALPSGVAAEFGDSVEPAPEPMRVFGASGSMMGEFSPAPGPCQRSAPTGKSSVRDGLRSGSQKTNRELSGSRRDAGPRQ
jgi:hypothetical protein